MSGVQSARLLFVHLTDSGTCLARRISRAGHAYEIVAFAVSRARKVHLIARTCFLRRQGSVKAHARIKQNKKKKKYKKEIKKRKNKKKQRKKKVKKN